MPLPEVGVTETAWYPDVLPHVPSCSQLLTAPCLSMAR